MNNSINRSTIILVDEFKPLEEWNKTDVNSFKYTHDTQNYFK